LEIKNKTHHLLLFDVAEAPEADVIILDHTLQAIGIISKI